MKTILPNRGVVVVTGEDRIVFLQGLVTNDVSRVTEDTAVYACLLGPQGRFLHDFFIIADGERLLLDCEADRRDDLMKRLRMFRLRAKVEINDETQVFSAGAVFAGLMPPEHDDVIAYPDPRQDGLGWRLLAPIPVMLENDPGAYEAYDRLRISLAIPDGSRDMNPGEALPMDYGMGRLNAIAWTKGCYVGQELTARMKYKAQPKVRLATVRVEGGSIDVGTVLMHEGREVGTMRSSCGDMGLALVRLDAGSEVVKSGDIGITVMPAQAGIQDC